MGDLANVNMYIDLYKELGSDYSAVPFGRIKRDVVEEAKRVLEELEPYIGDKEALEAKRRKAAVTVFASTSMDKEKDEEGYQARNSDKLNLNSAEKRYGSKKHPKKIVAHPEGGWGQKCMCISGK